MYIRVIQKHRVIDACLHTSESCHTRASRPVACVLCLCVDFQVCMRVWAWVCVCVCVCVWERECVCVREWEPERARNREREQERDVYTYTHTHAHTHTFSLPHTHSYPCRVCASNFADSFQLANAPTIPVRCSNLLAMRCRPMTNIPIRHRSIPCIRVNTHAYAHTHTYSTHTHPNVHGI